MRGPIQTRRYGSFLRAIWGLGGGTTPGDEASDQAVQVSMDLEPDPTVRPELCYPGGEQLGASAQSVAAGGAGVRSKVLLFNPLGSNQLTVLTSVLPFGNPTYLAVYPLAVTTGFTLANSEYARDTRWLSPWGAPTNASARSGLLVLVRNNNAVVAGEDVMFFMQSNVPWFDGYVLKPGSGVLLMASADNAGLTVSFVWRSRQALPQELNA